MVAQSDPDRSARICRTSDSCAPSTSIESERERSSRNCPTVKGLIEPCRARALSVRTRQYTERREVSREHLHSIAMRASAAVSVLGPTTVTAAGEAVEMRSVRQRRLLAALVLANGRISSADSLADAVWGDHLPVRPGAALQNQISRLRSAFGPASAAVETVPGGYRIAVDATTVDAVEFERRVHEARSLDAVARVEWLSAAVAMWRGGAYDDLDTDDSRTEARRLTGGAPGRGGGCGGRAD